MSDDRVDHPSHYAGGGIEVIDALEAWGLGFHLGNVVKYVARADHKGRALEDLKKARWYLDREIARRELEEGRAVSVKCGQHYDACPCRTVERDALRTENARLREAAEGARAALDVVEKCGLDLERAVPPYPHNHTPYDYGRYIQGEAIAMRRILTAALTPPGAVGQGDE